ncbi:ATP-binding protein [Kribbella sp. NPDC004536]|uniref:ATP-binding protein n=1 Tax=Kribbella sp. NPDC004536 TaxID=3364106 RepID=UPI0036B9834D
MATAKRLTNANVTMREVEILALIAHHLTNAEIADTLLISKRTVETHVSTLLRKLGHRDRRSLARYAESTPGLLAGTRRDRAMPAMTTAFIGRAAERAQLRSSLTGHRLVTAVGPGGIGKTRLALSVAGDLAGDFEDGAWFVDLAQITDSRLVTRTIADAVGVPDNNTGSTEHALIAALAARESLLVLDNCEHLLDAIRGCVQQILLDCPDVRVLATSRSRLLISSEWTVPVPPLSSDDGVALFRDRTAATGAQKRLDEDRVAALCDALHGSALAIELAAARYPAMGLDGLEAGLADRLRFFSVGPDGTDRHHSLLSAIGWSYDLLTPLEQALLRRTALFTSWFDVDAASVVAGYENNTGAVVDGLARLAEKSLVVVDRGTPVRYRSLETIRQYGVHQLDASGEKDDTRRRYLHWCQAMVQVLDEAPRNDSWRDRFDRVTNDVATALDWAEGLDESTCDRSEMGIRYADLLFTRGNLSQAQNRYEQAATRSASHKGRIGCLRQAAGVAATRFAGDDALQLLAASANLAELAGDFDGAARDLATMGMYIVRTPGIMATFHPIAEAKDLVARADALHPGSADAQAAIAVARDFGNAKAISETVDAVELAQQSEDPFLVSAALDRLTMIRLANHELTEAMDVANRRVQQLAKEPVTAALGYELGDALLMASDTALAAGDLNAAASHADALARLPFYQGENHIGVSRLITVDAFAGHFDRVVANGELFRVGWERAGRPAAAALCQAAYAVSTVHGMQGDDDRRAFWADLTIATGIEPHQMDRWGRGWAPIFDAMLALHKGDAQTAVERLVVDIDDPDVFRPSAGVPSGQWITGARWRPWYAAMWAEAAVLADLPIAERRLDRATDAVRGNPIAQTIIDRGAAILRGQHDRLPQIAATFARLRCPYQEARTRALSGRA